MGIGLSLQYLRAIVLAMACLTLGPYSWGFLPSLSQQDGQTCGMSCCRRSGICCCRNSRTVRPEIGWRAARTCPAGCLQRAVLPTALPGLTAQVIRAQADEDRSAKTNTPVESKLPGRIAAFALFQRPPPAVS
jgi:hypothetical protein